MKMAPGVDDHCAVFGRRTAKMASDGGAVDARRKRLGAGGSFDPLCFCHHLYVHNVAVHNISVVSFLFSINLRPCSTVRPTKATCCMKEIKSCNESETKAIFKELAQWFSFSFKSFSSCAKPFFFF